MTDIDPTVHDVAFLTRHAAYVDLSDNTGRLAPSHKKGEFRPERIGLEWTRTGKGEPWNLTRCMVSGRMLKKDGSLGQNTGDINYADIWGRDREKPAWLVSILADYSTALPED